MCHELRAWQRSGQAQESRRDLWREFEETTRRPDGEPTADQPRATEPERTEETVGAGA